MKQLLIPGVGGTLCGELIVDLFAGGGGASFGIEQALGRSPDIAINHDPHAIQMHEANHPATRHYCESVYDVDPRKATHGQAVGLLWLSPDCRHFSRAKGAAPVSKSVRALAWIGVRWAAAVRPRCIFLENVPEFLTWGPLMWAKDDAGNYLRATKNKKGKLVPDKNGEPYQIPDPARAGETFQRFIIRLQALGYVVEWRTLVAADLGAPTIRKRLYLVARRDGEPIVWPEPTHGKGRAEAWKPAADCIDWSLPCPSIFDRKKPLAEATCRRIAAGIARYVLGGNPFLVQVAHGERRDRPGFRGAGLDRPLTTVCATNNHALVAPSLVKLRNNCIGQPVTDPVHTITANGGHFGLVSAFLAKHYTGVVGSDLKDPLGTITQVDHHSVVAATLLHNTTGHAPGDVRKPLATLTTGNHHALVAAFLTKYYGEGSTAQGLDEPLHTIVQKARFGLVTIPLNGEEYILADIGLRMLEPHELAAAQGFPPSYVLTGTKAQKIARIGNSVCPPVAAAIVRANLAPRSARERAA